MALVNRRGRKDAVRAVLTAGLVGAALMGCAAPAKLPEPPAGPRLRVAVVDFENKTAYGARLGTAAADILVTELAHTERFVLVERAKLDKLMAEQKLGMTGAVDAETAARMGRLLGAAAIVTGAVSQFGVKVEGSDILIAASKRQIAEATVDARIVDVETGQIRHAETGSGTAKSGSGTFLGLGTSASYDEALEGKALRAAIGQLAAGISQQLGRIAWRCYVADVDGKEIYLDAGIRSNLSVGQELKSVRLGAEIKSPDSGLIIGHRETFLGVIRVVRHFSEDGAVAELISGRMPERGDICRLAAEPQKSP